MSLLLITTYKIVMNSWNIGCCLLYFTYYPKVVGKNASHTQVLFLMICWHKCGRVYWHHRPIVHSQSELTHNTTCLYIRYNSCGLSRKWDNRNLQISNTMDSSKAKKKIYTAKKKKHECHIKRTYINPFNRLNKIKDKFRSENSRKALLGFSISTTTKTF